MVKFKIRMWCFCVNNKAKSRIIGIISLAVILFSLYKIIVWQQDNNSTKQQIEAINNILKMEEVSDDMFDELITVPNSEESDYWKYTKLPLQKVDFSKLLAINIDTIAFISVPKTNINYPVVQSKDNDFYLNHTYDQSFNKAGWVFLDYRNDLKKIDTNNIIYAHGRKDKTMFGSLKDMLDTKWLEDVDNHYIRLITPNFSSVWQIVSIYKTDLNLYYLNTSFNNANEKQAFYDNMQDNSIHDFKVSLFSEDKVLTLSTCDGSRDRIVVHSKLIKIGYFPTNS